MESRKEEDEFQLMSEEIKRKRILVVDDESDLTLFYRMSLEYHGFEVETFNDPRKALSNFKTDYYDLIILDIKMPNMDGFELYSEIRKRDKKAKVCFLTASELYYKEFRMKEYSALDKSLFIRKPIGNEDMLKEIYRLIKA
jgi:DNA-binding response OmpR family regulator